MSHRYRLCCIALLALIHSACSGGDSSAAAAASGPQSLTVSVSGAGAVSSTPAGIDHCSSSSTSSCNASLRAGSVVTLTALADDGQTFSGWSGACSGTSAICTVTLDAAREVQARFIPVADCSPTGATALATTITSASGQMATNEAPMRRCPKATWGQVAGICYGDYAVQVNAYGTPPANTSFSMWAQNAGCWGVRVTEPANPRFVYWNAPLVTRGFSFGYTAPLTPAGGIPVGSLGQPGAGTQTACPSDGPSSSVCIKWSMRVPGMSPQSSVNTAGATQTNWDAMIDIYFHAVSRPAPGAAVTFDLQIYQMLMDWQATNGPNWATNMLHKYSTRTLGGITYLVTVNTQNPGTEGNNWVGNGGSLNTVALFPLPTYPTSKQAGASASYLWGTPSALHDVGAIIGWLSRPQTIDGVTGIFDDAGKPLYDNARHRPVTTPLIDPDAYLTGINPGFEVIQADPAGDRFPNNQVYTTTNYWVALPGEKTGN